MRKLLTFITLSIVLFSCGGNTKGANQFESVIVGIKNVNPPKLKSDVLVKKDSDKDGVCDSVQFQDDSIVVAIYSNSLRANDANFLPSPVYFDRYRLTFINASNGNLCEKNDTCRSLFSVPLERFLSVSLEPNSEAYASISVIPADWKNSVLVNFCSSPDSSCVYYVILELHGMEVYSGKEKWIKASFTVQIADYIQSNSLTVDQNGQISANAEKDDNCILNFGG